MRRLAVSAGCIVLAAGALVLDVVDERRGMRLYAMGLDFHIYYASARAGLHRGWASIYDFRVEALVQSSLTPPGHLLGLALPNHPYFFLPFFNPPAQAFLTAPFTLLPYHEAYGLWVVLSATALVGALLWASTAPWLDRIVLVLLALSTWTVYEGFHIGQTVAVVGAALLVASRLDREGRWLAAGLLLAVMAVKPQDAFLLPFALLAAGRWRTVATFALASLAIALVSLEVVGLPAIRTWIAELARWHNPFDALDTARGLFGTRAPIFEVAVAVVTIVSAWLWRARPEVVWAAGIVGSIAATPYIHVSDIGLLAVAGALAWGNGRQPVAAPAFAAAWVVSSALLDMLVQVTAGWWVPIESLLVAWFLVQALVGLRRHRAVAPVRTALVE